MEKGDLGGPDSVPHKVHLVIYHQIILLPPLHLLFLATNPHSRVL
jgi:hypothetical protein